MWVTWGWRRERGRRAAWDEGGEAGGGVQASRKRVNSSWGGRWGVVSDWRFDSAGDMFLIVR